MPLGLGLACVIPAGESQAKVLRIRIADMSFLPADVTASVGDVIEWRNEDFVDHTATETGGLFDAIIPAGQNATVAIGHAGSFSYICRFHPTMTGRVDAR